MITFDDIEAFRSEPQAQAFAKEWLREGRQESSDCSHQINLKIWQKTHPHQALAIILNLIENAGDDEDLAEMIASGPATEIVEGSDADFSRLLRVAIMKYPRFELYTRYLREHSTQPCWSRLRDPLRE